MELQAQPWYRNPFVWLVIALPAATVPAGLATLALAMHGADPVVRDDFRVDGLAINHDPVRDAAARDLNVHATLRVDGTTAYITLREGRAAVPERLTLLFSHATLATEDRQLRLDRTIQRTYAARQSALPAGHWYVELAPPDRAWRLTGELMGRTSSLELSPRAGP